MATVHIIKPAKPSFRSLEFGSYNEAIAFARKSAALNPSKPYKRIQGDRAPVWVVSLLNPAAIKSKPEYVTFRNGVPGFTGIASHLRMGA